MPEQFDPQKIAAAHAEALRENEVREKIREAQNRGTLAGIKTEEFKMINGHSCRKVYPGYTVRQWFSHSTPEAGPGPGWDRFVANSEGVFREYGLDPDKFKLRDIDPRNLPDEPYFYWEDDSDDGGSKDLLER